MRRRAVSDYGTMQQRIADELARSDLGSQIRNAIQSSIRKYERKRFYFNETTGDFTLSVGQYIYTESDFGPIGTLVDIDDLKITVSGTTYLLDERDYSYLNALDVSLTVGDPTDFAYYSRRIWLYPLPNVARIITMSYVEKAATLSANSDTNYWMTDAEALIREEAKADIYANVIRKPDSAVFFKQLAKEELEALSLETDSKGLSSGITVNQF